ncbi:MAG TPA: hypothetical protein VFO70_08070, partial [Chitinophagaceae bacterium]|nr:hypothetical protein [Chitinophagaceae bacterium]
MKKKLIILSVILELFIGTSNAQDTVRLSVRNVFTEIDRTYPQLQFYEAKISSIRAMVEGAKAWMPPTVALALDRFPYRFSMIKEKTPDNQAGIML